jgi:hypothetical protein
VATETDAVRGRRPGPAENADVHAGDVHVHVPMGSGRSRDLLRRDEPAEYRAAVLHELLDGTAPRTRAPASGGA